jgi:hypothetical protein
MPSRALRLAAVLLAALACTGCIGAIRQTTSPRTSTEMLLVTTAAQRAVLAYEPGQVLNRRVFIDMSNFDSIDRGYVIGAVRDHLSGYGAILVDAIELADLVVEVRNGALGIYDGEFTLGMPSLPITAPGLTTALITPPLYIFKRNTEQGWAKFQVWSYDARTGRFLGRSPDLWGSAYYNQWFWFGIGPFDGSNDIYPEWDMKQFLGEREPHPPPPAPAQGLPPPSGPGYGPAGSAGKARAGQGQGHGGGRGSAGGHPPSGEGNESAPRGDGQER